MVKVSRSIVPSFFTVGNMFCGLYSVISAFAGNFSLAAWMILFSAFLDAMDGKVARFTGSSSRFGVEYDSLADVISFGFAPSILVYTTYAKNMGIVGLLLSFLPLLFGSIRLARFNIQLKGFDKDFFNGLPIPIAAMAIASSILFSQFFYDVPVKYPKVMIILIFLVSILMVSTIRYEKMPNLKIKGSARDKTKLMLFLVGIIIFIIFPSQALFPMMLLYIFSGMVAWVLRLNRGVSSIEEGL
jgi:CDP-diacylglycerol--serine O-phosphatidyltransferase